MNMAHIKTYEHFISLSSKNAVLMTLQDQEYAIAGFLGMEK